MKYPNVKPQQGEQQDANQRRYPDDNIEVAGKSDQETQEARNHNPLREKKSEPQEGNRP